MTDKGKEKTTTKVFVERKFAEEEGGYYDGDFYFTKDGSNFFYYD